MGLLSTIGAASGRAFGLTRVGAAIRDAYFNLTTLLLPGNGTNGAQNNTFLDSSPNNFTITRNGNTTQGTFSPFSQTGWSNYFDGTSDYLTAVGSNLALGTGDFTIEFWFYANAYSATTDSSFMFDSRSGNNTSGFFIGPVFNNTQTLHVGQNTSPIITASTTYSLNTWIHCAVVRSSGTITLYQNGVNVGSVANTTNNTATTNYIASGWWLPTGSGQTFNGYLNNLRISNTARYTSGFTPPTAAFASDANTRLLACQSNRFADSSSNGYAVTPFGTPSVQAFSPFAPTAAYSAATVGGSGYFDGTGDNLAVPTNSANSVGSGSFYFEAWVYLTNPSVAQMIIADPSNTGGLFVGLNIDGGSRFTIGRTAVGVDNLVTVTWIGNQWYHLAVNRNGTSLQFFVNGTQVGSTGTNSVNYPSVGYRVGAEQSAGSSPLTGYISGLRLVKSSVNTTNFTPPTAPPDASTAALCLQFTNAGITDATAKNVLETVGNAQISTTQSKFGGSSMYFDGTGDWLLLPASPNMAMGTGDFTFECWIYATAASDQPIYECRSTTSNTDGFTVTAFSSTVIRVYTNAVLVTATVSNYLNTWTHVAFTRAGSTNRLFINGTLQNTATASDNFSSQVAVVGGGRYGSNNIDKSFTGYIDDLRITKGYARYTASFTAPTAAFALQ